LPIDIRHITFSATNVAYALVAFDFEPDRHLLLMGIFGVGVIGLTNLVVSFALALLVALRARGVSALQGTGLVGKLLQRMLLQPRQFLLPPKRQKQGVSVKS